MRGSHGILGRLSAFPPFLSLTRSFLALVLALPKLFEEVPVLDGVGCSVYFREAKHPRAFFGHATSPPIFASAHKHLVDFDDLSLAAQHHSALGALFADLLAHGLLDAANVLLHGAVVGTSQAHNGLRADMQGKTRRHKEEKRHISDLAPVEGTVCCAAWSRCT